jgi:acyl-coenzyme A thioesterase PaaI-like protein
MNDFRQMFQGDEFSKFRDLIVQSGKKQNGRSLAHIGSDALTAAFEGVTLTEDQQALVDMTVNTINFIEYISSDGMVSSRGQSAFSGELSKMRLPMETIISANGGIPASIISTLGGGGLTTPTGQGTHSVMVGSNHQHGRAVTTGHEVIGHGRSLAVGRGHANQHVDAAQTENLILRVMGINHINNGSTHAHGEIIRYPSALPAFR